MSLVGGAQPRRLTPLSLKVRPAAKVDHAAAPDRRVHDPTSTKCKLDPHPVHHACVCCAVLCCDITWTGTNESFQLHRTGMSYTGHGWVELKEYVDVSFLAERGSNYEHSQLSGVRKRPPSFQAPPDWQLSRMTMVRIFFSLSLLSHSFNCHPLTAGFPQQKAGGLTGKHKNNNQLV